MWNVYLPPTELTAPGSNAPSVVSRLGVVGYFFSYSIYRLFENFRGYAGYIPDSGLLDKFNWLRCRIEARSCFPGFFGSIPELDGWIRTTNLRPRMALGFPTYRDDGAELTTIMNGNRSRLGRYPGRGDIQVNSIDWHRRWAQVGDFRPLYFLPTGDTSLRQDIANTLAFLHDRPQDATELNLAWTMLCNLSIFLTTAAWAYQQYPRTIGITWSNWAGRNLRCMPIHANNLQQEESSGIVFARTILQQAGEEPQAAAR